MKITAKDLRSVIREELQKEMKGHHPVTGMAAVPGGRVQDWSSKELMLRSPKSVIIKPAAGLTDDEAVEEIRLKFRKRYVPARLQLYRDDDGAIYGTYRVDVDDWTA
jgi:hypothetical protein